MGLLVGVANKTGPRGVGGTPLPGTDTGLLVGVANKTGPRGVGGTALARKDMGLLVGVANKTGPRGVGGTSLAGADTELLVGVARDANKSEPAVGALPAEADMPAGLVVVGEEPHPRMTTCT